MENDDSIKDFLQKEFTIELASKLSLDEAKKIVGEHINYLINHQFEQLLSLLYRIDISELALRKLLSENPGYDAGKIITEQIIERQLQKIKTREQYKKENNIPDEDKW